MTFSTLLSQDPMLGLELCALVLSFCYLTRLMLNPLWPQYRSQLADSDYPTKNRVFANNPITQWFSVGQLISLPKRSLKRQKRKAVRKIAMNY